MLRRAHRVAMRNGDPPEILRPVVAQSWRRATELGVDPTRRPPLVLDEAQTRRRLAQHPLSRLLTSVMNMLSEATDGGGYFVALGDPDGVLLWLDGHPTGLELAARLGFLPGHLCSEAAVGTNAVGTSLELDHAVQIFSAEHFNRRLHALTCAAAPIRDPETRKTLGVLDLSGDFRTGHPHSLSLVAAMARTVEVMLAQERTKQENGLRARYLNHLTVGRNGPSALVLPDGRVIASSPGGWLGGRVRVERDGSLVLPEGVEFDPRFEDQATGATVIAAGSDVPVRRRCKVVLKTIGPRRLSISVDGWSFELAGRHGEIVLLLALHPRGLTAKELGLLIQTDKPMQIGTVRAEISRLRRRLGPVLTKAPYRLDAVVEGQGREMLRLLRVAA